MHASCTRIQVNDAPHAALFHNLIYQNLKQLANTSISVTSMPKFRNLLSESTPIESTSKRTRSKVDVIVLSDQSALQADPIVCDNEVSLEYCSLNAEIRIPTHILSNLQCDQYHR